MNISPLSFPVAMPRRRVLAAYVQETRAECLRYLRSPSFLLPTLLFPAVFFLMFGVVLVGTYTSIFIAAPILIYLGVGTHRLDEPAEKPVKPEPGAPPAAEEVPARFVDPEPTAPAAKPAKAGKPKKR